MFLYKSFYGTSVWAPGESRRRHGSLELNSSSSKTVLSRLCSLTFHILIHVYILCEFVKTIELDPMFCFHYDISKSLLFPVVTAGPGR